MSWLSKGLQIACLALCFIGSQLYASVNGEAVPLHRQGGKDHQAPLSLSIGVESVLSEVEYEPHLDGGGFASVENEPRYQAGRLGLTWSPTSRLDVRFSWSSRTIVSKRDQYELDSYYLSLRYALLGKPYAWAVSFGASFGSNRAEHLTKTSFTQYEDLLITRAGLQRPTDQQVQVNLFFSRLLSTGIDAVAYIGAGQAVLDNDGFSGTVRDGNKCRYSVNLNDNEHSIELIDPCGAVKSFRRQYPDNAAFEQKFGIGFEDVIDTTRYWQLGAQLARGKGRLRYGIGYNFQQFYRGSIDTRLADRGGEPLEMNHTLSGWWHYQLSPRLQFEFGAQYSQHPMLNSLFVLYTAFTSERFRQDAVLFSLGFRYRFVNRSIPF